MSDNLSGPQFLGSMICLIGAGALGLYLRSKWQPPEPQSVGEVIDSAKKFIDDGTENLFSQTHIELQQAKKDLLGAEITLRNWEMEYDPSTELLNPETGSRLITDTKTYHKVQTAKALVRRYEAEVNRLENKYAQEMAKLKSK